MDEVGRTESHTSGASSMDVPETMVPFWQCAAGYRFDIPYLFRVGCASSCLIKTGK
ncbi:hypothetical protein ACE3MS_14345 [Paenibacillus dendritiformis]|uniref:Uncharacterized protein n=1 Tax=Paenibacillus melissococcoides TaxID=2912268 RepID=A0ABM9G080_9BACL|nr:hypothetical protein [Paenibacillus melissococcoides]CAH8244601.1 hypothetical protein WJ0W_001832 [Paenibacillus melissococcoides]CAH8709176.1 hypothetical protein HTL2_002204 [Paenibacillus melissococcoides]